MCFSRRGPLEGAYSGAAKSKNPIPKQSAVAAKAAPADKDPGYDGFNGMPGSDTKHNQNTIRGGLMMASIVDSRM